jgi:hypothetical protein
MERMEIIYLFPLVCFIPVFSSCHPRHVSDIKPNMTKEEVASLWGRTPLLTHRSVDGKGVETWEYHFYTSDSNCWVTFSQDRVTATQCRPLPGGIYLSLVREGYFAMELAGVLKVGEVKSEAEAKSKLASVGIAPKNEWIADYPMTPDIIGELRNAVGEAADSGKIGMNQEEAIRAFQDLIASIESQNAGGEHPQVANPLPPFEYSIDTPFLI